jgi:hypothetical protein
MMATSVPLRDEPERFAASCHQAREAVMRLQHVGIEIKERSKSGTPLQR